MNQTFCKTSYLYTLIIFLSLLLFAGCGDDGSSAKSTDSESASQSASDILEEFSGYVTDGDWSWKVPKEDYLNSKIDYGTMKDSRDGQTYKTATIGKQTWMAENLNYADSSKTPSLKGKSWCYDNVAKNCSVTGRFYTWAAAIDSVKLAKDEENPQKCGYGKPCFLPSQVQGVCPEGWHLPSKDEWETLIATVGGESVAGKALKSQKGWDSKYIHGNGTDAYGFSGLPTFYLNETGSAASFWSSSQYNTEKTYSVGLFATSDETSLSESLSDGDNSIRCIKDDESYVPNNPKPVYDSITDSRDGTVYKTVKIGKQTWMAENLKYADSAETPSLKGNSLCYDDEEENCDKYGRLYTWAAAIDSVKLYKDKSLKCGYGKACSLPSKVQGICPEGWHLPSYDEWDTLIDSVGGRDRAGMVLKSRSDWSENKGTDTYGFSALPAGTGYSNHYSYDDEDVVKNIFDDRSEETNFWSSTQECARRYDSEKDVVYCDLNEESYEDAYALEIKTYDSVFQSDFGKSDGFSIRCIKDQLIGGSYEKEYLYTHSISPILTHELR